MNYTTFPSNSSHNETIIRPAAFADVSYPANPIKLSRLLDTAPDTVRSFLQHVPPTLASIRQGAEAIVAPHIDFRVGLNTYAPAFQALRDSTADVFVVIATSHYGWQDLFIPTFQHFSTPLGVVRTDTELLNELYKRLPYSLTRDEIAHRDEHSIEFEAVWLQHLFGGRKFTMLPILVTSFYPSIQRSTQPNMMLKFRSFVETLNTVLEDSGKKVAWVASGDMAHVGRKFDDQFDAETIVDTLSCEDAELLAAMEKADAEKYFDRIAAVGDSRKICGLPPVYTMLEALKRKNTEIVGQTLDYQIWNERSTRSAVSYASLAYYRGCSD